MVALGGARCGGSGSSDLVGPPPAAGAVELDAPAALVPMAALVGVVLRHDHVVPDHGPGLERAPPRAGACPRAAPQPPATRRTNGPACSARPAPTSRPSAFTPRTLNEWSP